LVLLWNLSRWMRERIPPFFTLTVLLAARPAAAASAAAPGWRAKSTDSGFWQAGQEAWR
jgi:hypothetical protein